MKLKHIAIVLLFLSGLILQACSAPKTCDEITNGQECLRILFIGNSYTFTNDLPGTFAELARSGAHQVEVQMVAEGGWGFDDHMFAFDTITAIKSKEWDYIVLQERSQNPAVPYSRTNDMYPAARALVAQIRAVGAKPIFFVTWGYKNGSPDIELLDYISMQIAVDKGYQHCPGVECDPCAGRRCLVQRAQSLAAPGVMAGGWKPSFSNRNISRCKRVLCNHFQ